MLIYSNEQVLEACRTIRPFLPKLLADAQTVQEIDHQLAQLLNQNDLEENTRVDHLIAILESYQKTKEWLDNFLSSKARFYESLGHFEFQRPPKYVCPEGDFIWYQTSNDIPRCTTHSIVLIPDQNKSSL